MEEDSQENKKPHRNRRSGRKAEKKRAKNVHTQELTDKQRNKKAFTFHSAVRAERQFRRAQDIQTKKQHIPVIDRTPLEPPPIMVVVVGPPKVGKTTLIQCLVKNFTKQPLTAIKGPVTFVSGKRRRITLIECNNDINSMLDLAKIADLVLLLIDASFGFEMEIFEFLNICQVHGMPKVMGVLTHLDMLKNNKTLKCVKKTLKHRFWTEVYAGAKLFYLSGILHGEYLRNEIANLGRFISVMKFRPLMWQMTHSYVLVDRIEDLTPPESIRQNLKVDRTVSLYGFVRGIPLNKASVVHIPGCGDMKIHDVCFLPDPCPLPEKLKKRSLVEKERIMYAPFSGVGGIVYDKDAVYIELAGSHSHLQNNNKEEPERELVMSLMDTKETLDAKISKSTVKLFSDATPITASDFMVQLNLEKEPSKQEYTDNKRIVSSSHTDNLEHSDTENDSASYQNEGDATKKRKIGSSVNDENGKTNDGRDSETNIHIKSKKKISTEENKKCETERTVGVISRKVLEEKIVFFEDGRTRRKINFSGSNDDDDDDGDGDGDDGGGGDDDDDDDDDNSDNEGSGHKNDNTVMCKRNISYANKNCNNDNYDSIGEITFWKSDVQQLSSKSNEEDLTSKNKSINGIKASKTTEHNRNMSYHESITKRDRDVFSRVSNDLTKLHNLKQKDSRDRSVGKALSNSTWLEYSFGNDSGSDAFIKKEQKVTVSDNEMEDDDYDYGNDVNNDTSDNMGEFSSDTSVEADENDVTGPEESDSALKWKSDIIQKARNSFIERQSQTTNLWKLIYGCAVYMEENNDLSEEEKEELGGLFKVISKKQEEKKKLKEVINALDTSKVVSPGLQDWSLEKVRDIIKDCFVTGNWKQSEDVNELLQLDDMSGDEIFGDFEDLESGEKQSGKGAKAERDGTDETKAKEPLTKAQLLEKKEKLKEKFDAEYDDRDGKDMTYYDEMKQEVAKQAELNRNQFEGLDDAVRVQLEGFRAGMYVRIELKSVPCELVTNFDPTYPIIVGGLQTGEENIGFVKVRIKKHRWYKKILKTKDPIIISLGWRRFQTLPVYSKQEDNMRYRMLKYTPEHVACIAQFWGPLTRPNTGFLAVQDVATKPIGFRIVATGSVIDTNQSTEVTKKLKLTGVPLKIYKKTAFIRGMFNSSLEVAKFEGARIKTVSGIRGQIKKAVNKPEGAFRATFEDKIQLSDIVFCRTWYRVEVPKFYNPVTSLLLLPEQKNLWQGMKTVGQLKREHGMHSEPQLDSMYTPIQRESPVFKPLSVPRKLQKGLPYKDKPKFTSKPGTIKRVAVIRDEHESKVASVMKKIRTIYQHKQREDRQAALARLREHRNQLEADNARRQSKEKEQKKQFHRMLSKKHAKNISF